MTFFDLLAQSSADGGTAGVDRRFYDLVEQSPFELWSPGDPIPQHAVRLLIGVATSSAPDMALLDVIAEAMARGPSAMPAVDVFNTADCPRQESFRKYIPTLRDVADTPVAAIWFGGQLTWRGQGQRAREEIARMFGTSFKRVAEYLQRRTQPDGVRFA